MISPTSRALVVACAAMGLAACSVGQFANPLRPVPAAPAPAAPSVASGAISLLPSGGSSVLAFSAARYQSSRDFKALARAAGRYVGAGKAEGSLIAAERAALKECTQTSQYQGECEITRVGDQTIEGLDEQSEQRVRWAYLRSVHGRLSVKNPVKLRLPVKVLQPGSMLTDGDLYLSGDYINGGYSAIRFGERTCTGSLDPIERKPTDDAESDRKRPPIGIMEYACDNGEVLRGGYVRVNAANQIFFLEDLRKERWDFIASTDNAGVGSDLAAFKALYKRIERTD